MVPEGFYVRRLVAESLTWFLEIDYVRYLWRAAVETFRSDCRSPYSRWSGPRSPVADKPKGFWRSRFDCKVSACPPGKDSRLDLQDIARQREFLRIIDTALLRATLTPLPC